MPLNFHIESRSYGGEFHGEAIRLKTHFCTLARHLTNGERHKKWRMVSGWKVVQGDVVAESFSCSFLGSLGFLGSCCATHDDDCVGRLPILRRKEWRSGKAFCVVGEILFPPWRWVAAHVIPTHDWCLIRLSSRFTFWVFPLRISCWGQKAINAYMRWRKKGFQCASIIWYFESQRLTAKSRFRDACPLCIFLVFLCREIGSKKLFFFLLRRKGKKSERVVQVVGDIWLLSAATCKCKQNAILALAAMRLTIRKTKNDSNQVENCAQFPSSVCMRVICSLDVNNKRAAPK